MTCGAAGAGLSLGVAGVRVGATTVMVIKLGSGGEGVEDAEDVVVLLSSGIGVVVSRRLAGIVTTATEADVGVDTDATRPRTLDAVALSVHSTTTPAVEFIGIAKHSEPALHKLITKLPASLQVAVLPERQAILPDTHGEEKLSVEKKVL